jgi:hypothetical protein
MDDGQMFVAAHGKPCVEVGKVDERRRWGLIRQPSSPLTNLQFSHRLRPPPGMSDDLQSRPLRNMQASVACSICSRLCFRRGRVSSKLLIMRESIQGTGGYSTSRLGIPGESPQSADKSCHVLCWYGGEDTRGNEAWRRTLCNPLPAPNSDKAQRGVAAYRNHEIPPYINENKGTEKMSGLTLRVPADGGLLRHLVQTPSLL